MSAEHRRPNGKLEIGYFCFNCGMPCGLYGHIRGDEFTCVANPRLVKQVIAANPPVGVKPRYVLSV